MLDRRALWERQLIQVKRADRMPKSTCHVMNCLIEEISAAHPILFGLEPERPCPEKVSCGHKILVRLPSYSGRHHTVGPLHLSSLTLGFR